MCPQGHPWNRSPSLAWAFEVQALCFQCPAGLPQWQHYPKNRFGFRIRIHLTEKLCFKEAETHSWRRVPFRPKLFGHGFGQETIGLRTGLESPECARNAAHEDLEGRAWREERGEAPPLPKQNRPDPKARPVVLTRKCIWKSIPSLNYFKSEASPT
jgi:hypothetical protein